MSFSNAKQQLHQIITQYNVYRPNKYLGRKKEKKKKKEKETGLLILSDVYLNLQRDKSIEWLDWRPQPFCWPFPLDEEKGLAIDTTRCSDVTVPQSKRNETYPSPASLSTRSYSFVLVRFHLCFPSLLFFLHNRLRNKLWKAYA